MDIMIRCNECGASFRSSVDHECICKEVASLKEKVEWSSAIQKALSERHEVLTLENARLREAFKEAEAYMYAMSSSPGDAPGMWLVRYRDLMDRN